MAQDVAAAPAAFARAPEAQAAAAPPKAKRSPRRFILPLIVIAAAAYGAHWGYGYFTEGRFLVSTDDAYVGADIGDRRAEDRRLRHRGPRRQQPGSPRRRPPGAHRRRRLSSSPSKPPRTKVATQDATIARIGRQIEAQARDHRAGRGAGRPPRRAPPTAPTPTRSAPRWSSTARKSWRRPASARSSGSNRRPPTRSAPPRAVAGAKATLASAQAQLAGAKANVDVLEAQQSEAEHTRAELANAVERAERDLSFTEIRAPFDGVVGNKAVEVGQYVQPGARLLAVVPLDEVYVDANFKETQLAEIQPGQKVDVSVDAFGGRVDRGRRALGRAGVRRAILAAAARQRHRQFHQDRAARHGAHRLRSPRRVQGSPAARRASRSSPPSIRATRSCPKPTLIGALGLGTEGLGAPRDPRRARPRQGAPVTARRAAAGGRAAPRRRSTSASSSPSSSWCSGCSWRSWTSRSSRRP